MLEYEDFAPGKWYSLALFHLLHQTFCDLSRRMELHWYVASCSILPLHFLPWQTCAVADSPFEGLNVHSHSWMRRTLRQNTQTKWEWIGWEDTGLSGIGPFSLLVSLSLSFKYVAKVHDINVLNIWATDKRIMQSNIRSNNTGLQHFFNFLYPGFHLQKSITVCNLTPHKERFSNQASRDSPQGLTNLLPKPVILCLPFNANMPSSSVNTVDGLLLRPQIALIGSSLLWPWMQDRWW